MCNIHAEINILPSKTFHSQSDLTLNDCQVPFREETEVSLHHKTVKGPNSFEWVESHVWKLIMNKRKGQSGAWSKHSLLGNFTEVASWTASTSLRASTARLQTCARLHFFSLLCGSVRVYGMRYGVTDREAFNEKFTPTVFTLHTF